MSRLCCQISLWPVGVCLRATLSGNKACGLQQAVIAAARTLLPSTWLLSGSHTKAFAKFNDIREAETKREKESKCTKASNDEKLFAICYPNEKWRDVKYATQRMFSFPTTFVRSAARNRRVKVLKNKKKKFKLTKFQEENSKITIG